MQQVDVAPTPVPPSPDPRGTLEDLVIRQLLGPWDGPEEIVDEPTVRGRYLVGMLAPRGSSGIPEEYDEGEVGGSDGEDGNADAPAPKAATAMLPASIGLTFAVALEATALRVTVRWGRYIRTTVEEERYLHDGNYRRVWRRSPVAVTLPELPLVHGRIGPLPIHPEQEGVTLQGMIRKRQSEMISTVRSVHATFTLAVSMRASRLLLPRASLSPVSMATSTTFPGLSLSIADQPTVRHNCA